MNGRKHKTISSGRMKNQDGFYKLSAFQSTTMERKLKLGVKSYPPRTRRRKTFRLNGGYVDQLTEKLANLLVLLGCLFSENFDLASQLLGKGSH